MHMFPTSILVSLISALCGLAPLLVSAAPKASPVPIASPSSSPVPSVSPKALPEPLVPSKAATQNTAASSSQIVFDHIDEGLIFFKKQDSAPNSDLIPVNSGLFHLSYLGVIHPEDRKGEPYFLFSGKPCLNCLDERTIYALRPTGGKPLPFVYPGKILDPKSKELLLESRGFFGKCLAHEKGDVLVVFQKEKVDRRPRLQASVLLSKVTQNFLAETLMEKHLPYLPKRS